MSNIDEYKAKLRARKAAALGMSLEQFDAHVEAEVQKQRAINRALLDKDHQWAVIVANANFFKRSFHKLG